MPWWEFDRQHIAGGVILAFGVGFAYTVMKKLKAYEKEIQNLRITRGKDPVCFLAALDKEITPKTGTTLLCGTVTTNEGNGYDGRTGTFTAPVSGSYQFTLTLGMGTPKEADDYLRLHIMVNENIVGFLYVGPQGVWLKRSENTVVQLKKGDHVYVRIKTATDQYAIGEQSDLYPGATFHTHFSGFLIH